MADRGTGPLRVAGPFRAGTSGFAYPDWAPRFYPADLRDRDRLAFYATRLRACELNNTYYRRPSSERLRAWAGATPADFRFIVKAQKGATFRLLRGPVETLAATVAWLTDDLPALGERLGAVLLRVPDQAERDGERLQVILEAWPSAIPLVIEARHASWHVDETFTALTRAGASLCATDLDSQTEPDLRRLGGPLYVRLRRSTYDGAAVERWAARLAPFVGAGDQVYALFRHDADGRSAHAAIELQRAMEARLAAETGG